MKRFKNISLVYECDQHTLERAALLAKENQGRLTIVHAIKEFPSPPNEFYVDRKPIDMKRLLIDYFQERMDEVAASVRALGVNPETCILEGEPFVEIIRDVIAHHRDLIIMTMDGKASWREFFFGNTLSSMIRNCPCPVLAVKAKENKSFRKILVAVDPVLVGDSHDTLNQGILEIAASLAQLENAELHVVHAWRLVGESMLRGRFGVPAVDVDRAVQLEFERLRELMDSLLKQHSISSAQIHLPQGEAVQSITKLAKDLAVDLLVMGTVCRTGVPGFVIGNTAEQVLNSVECSTLTVKPLGFVSPVTLR